MGLKEIIYFIRTFSQVRLASAKAIPEKKRNTLNISNQLYLDIFQKLLNLFYRPSQNKAIEKLNHGLGIQKYFAFLA